jgi:hypothetical protein
MNASIEYMNAMAREYERQGATLRRELNALRAQEVEAAGNRRHGIRISLPQILRRPRVALRRA